MASSRQPRALTLEIREEAASGSSWMKLVCVCSVVPSSLQLYGLEVSFDFSPRSSFQDASAYPVGSNSKINLNFFPSSPSPCHCPVTLAPEGNLHSVCRLWLPSTLTTPTAPVSSWISGPLLPLPSLLSLPQPLQPLLPQPPFILLSLVSSLAGLNSNTPDQRGLL